MRHQSLIGTDAPSSIVADYELRELGGSIAGGILGKTIWKKHPVLGTIGGFSIGRTATGLATGSVSSREAIANIGSHAIAIAGSLALPRHPIIGYIAGAATGGLLLSTQVESQRRIDMILGAVGSSTTWTPAPSLADVRAGNATIKKGMKGDSVLYVQGVAGASADGEFGNDTEKAVVVFQAAHGIGSTGIVDRATMAAMDTLAGGQGSVEKIDFTKPTAPVRSSAPSSVPASYAPSLPIAAAPSDSSMPAWQYGAIGVGGLAIGYGIYRLVRR